MITDIDMIPMNRTYYTKHIEEFDNSKFIYLRGVILFNVKQMAMCYNVATPEIWREIFEINTVEDIINKIKHVAQNNTIRPGHGKQGWSLDQLILYQKVTEWNKKTHNFACVKDTTTGFNRLNRTSFSLNDAIKKNISRGAYSDYHCYRPMSQYSKINNDIYDLL
jgi:hypothetical protein